MLLSPKSNRLWQMEDHPLHRAQHQLQRDWHPNPTRPLLAAGQEVKCGNLLQSGSRLASLSPPLGSDGNRQALISGCMFKVPDA